MISFLGLYFVHYCVFFQVSSKSLVKLGGVRKLISKCNRKKSKVLQVFEFSSDNFTCLFALHVKNFTRLLRSKTEIIHIKPIPTGPEAFVNKYYLNEQSVRERRI